MKCPVCNVLMHDIRTKSHYGLYIFLDQCPKCGGLWIDEDELFRINRGEARKFDMFGSFPNEYAETKKILKCPRHHIPLIKFQDPYFPPNIQAYKCPICKGFWFRHGDFSILQEHIDKRWAVEKNL